MPENTDVAGLIDSLRAIEESVTEVTETDLKPSLEPKEVEAAALENRKDINNQDHETLQDGYLDSLNIKIAQTIKCLEDIQNNVSKLQAENAVIQAEADGKITDNNLRKEMADKTFGFMEKWCAFVALIVFIYFAKKNGEPPTEFMLALLGTCTVSIIGLVGFVVSGLFKSQNKAPKATKDSKD